MVTCLSLCSLYIEVTIMKVDLRYQVFVWGRLHYLAGGGGIIIYTMYPLSPIQMNIPDNYKQLQDFL